VGIKTWALTPVDCYLALKMGRSTRGQFCVFSSIQNISCFFLHFGLWQLCHNWRYRNIGCRVPYIFVLGLIRRKDFGKKKFSCFFLHFGFGNCAITDDTGTLGAGSHTFLCLVWYVERISGRKNFVLFFTFLSTFVPWHMCHISKISESYGDITFGFGLAQARHNFFFLAILV
jgi:hypothetical protein